MTCQDLQGLITIRTCHSKIRYWSQTKFTFSALTAILSHTIFSPPGHLMYRYRNFVINDQRSLSRGGEQSRGIKISVSIYCRSLVSLQATWTTQQVVGTRVLGASQALSKQGSQDCRNRRAAPPPPDRPTQLIWHKLQICFYQIVKDFSAQKSWQLDPCPGLQGMSNLQFL